MTRHATTELLSAYVDHELPNGEQQRVEDHLAKCDVCRGEMESLRRVATSLNRLERLSPPPFLAHQVQRRLALEGKPRTLLERVEARLHRIPIQPSLGATFALVFALAIILYLFSTALEKSRHRTDIVVVPPLAGVAEPRDLAGRVFELREEVWVEQDLGEADPAEILDPLSAEAEEALTGFPQAVELMADGQAVRFRAGERVVELRALGDDRRKEEILQLRSRLLRLESKKAPAPEP